MGLFWSMRSSPSMPPGIKLLNKAALPLLTDLTVYLGHLTFEETYSNTVKPVLKKRIKRWYMGKGVQRITVRSGRLRGALFLPTGKYRLHSIK